MKLKAPVTLVVAAAVLVIIVALTTFAEIQKAPPRVVWEYRDGANMQLKEINDFGAEGWELAAVVSYGGDHYFLFKRPK
ncbi:MAG: hypothetical protein AB1428_04620 [Bacteroidota bacterium]